MLPAVMDFNRPATARRQRMLAEAMGIDVAGESDEAAAAHASARISELILQMNVKPRLSAWGVPEEELAGIAKGVLEDYMVATNPIPVDRAETIEQILQSAY